ncbi:hypothetical protein EDC64_11822 [Aquabacter spiritensis]|uniref:Uncharacterized protein n=2 Tax=Aquabacter spiritensis TaxID=933073 RepID=A0A4R3LMJ3_9HYPH|nr:hypothetical protein EDC64_11822 [Aquabacter spiritensis]
MIGKSKSPVRGAVKRFGEMRDRGGRVTASEDIRAGVHRRLDRIAMRLDLVELPH